uniref:Odorant receptor, family A, subfamily 112, member 1 n=1 Tax=Cyprinus carpio TaxID=7962 RepID=A0A8C1V0X8_CYPCA
MGDRSVNFSFTEFQLIGFTDLKAYRPLLFIPFCIILVYTVFANGILIIIIAKERKLHAPMYILIGLIAALGFFAPIHFIPRMLVGFLWEMNTITRHECLIQMFCLHFFACFQSTIVLGMAVDRYFAIIYPLRYTLLFTLIRSGTIMFTLVALAAPLSFCESNVIHHCYCDHMALVSLACDSISKNNAMGLVVIICFVGIDISVIFFSYVKILHVVLGAAAGEDRWKAFHTYGTHLMVMMCFYFVGSITFLSRNLNIPIPVDVNTFLGVMYIVFPASVNPIIYGVRTKEIRNALLKMFKTNINRVSIVKVSMIKI